MSNKVLNLALLTSIIGLLILSYVSESLTPPASSISSLDSNNLGKNVKVRGEVLAVHRFEGGSILLTLSDGSGEVEVYIPYGSASILGDNLSTDKTLEVIGELQTYNGRLELVPSGPEDVRLL
ncbi:MAG: OB-fold nucleic acid binding domain-containing protein [Candidatus Altiarchaeota archaeon]